MSHKKAISTGQIIHFSKNHNNYMMGRIAGILGVITGILEDA